MKQSDVKAIREFNRLYAVRLDVFDRRALGTSYSLAEGRVIIEIGRAQGCTANGICTLLGMDKGYLSRIIGKLESQGLIVRKTSAADARSKLLTLSASGKRVYADLERLSDEQAKRMFSDLDQVQIDQVLHHMGALRSALTGGGDVDDALEDIHGCRIGDAYGRIDEVRDLMREYIEKEIGERRGFDVGFQHPDEELAGLPGKYARPEGGLFIALCKGKPAGCIAFKRLDAGRCELKRLYVRSDYRGLHLGRTLLTHALAQARAAGYVWGYCDTDASMVEAISLYGKMGFESIEAYYDNPLPGARYFRKRLVEESC